MASRRDEEKEGPLGHRLCVCLSHIGIAISQELPSVFAVPRFNFRR